MNCRYILPLALFFAFATDSNASFSDTIPRTKTLSKIRLTDNTLLYGYIVQADDSSITFIKKADWKKQLYMHRETLPAEKIAAVTKNFKNGMTAGEGILLGAAAGIIIGFSLGLTRDCDTPDGSCDFTDRLFSTKNFSASLFLGGALGLIGMCIGLFSKKKEKMNYHIGGSRDNIKYNKIGLTF
jgi:hypothetical protein